MDPTAVPRFDVCDALLRSHATPLRVAPVGAQGAWLVHWCNADTETAYAQLQHHTLSLYLDGGEAVRCREHPQARGGVGSLCCMPAGHTSRWDVRGRLQILHLYLPRLPLAEAAERWFDLDPRIASPRDRIYFEDPVLASLGQRIAALDWQAPDAALQLEHLALQMQARLLLEHSGARRPLPALRGGLSPAARRRVLERIERSFDGMGSPAPTLRELADSACLSEFHFARMFKASFGMAPHAWLMQRRLAVARGLLVQGRWTAQQVAERAGYAHLGHLNTALRRAGLGSATRYREAVAASQAPVAAS